MSDFTSGRPAGRRGLVLQEATRHGHVTETRHDRECATGTADQAARRFNIARGRKATSRHYGLDPRDRPPGFAVGTLESVSIQKIADAIGYSKGTVLKYFPTKLLLSLAVKQQNWRTWPRSLSASAYAIPTAGPGYDV